MSKLYAEVLDDEDNVIYPHTSSEIVYFSESNVENLATKATYFDYMIEAGEYAPKQYETPGFIRAGDLYFNGEYITQKHYLGTRVTVVPGVKYSITFSLAKNVNVTDVNPYILVVDKSYKTLFGEQLRFINGQYTGQYEALPNSQYYIIGTSGVCTNPNRVAQKVLKNLAVVDVSTSNHTLEEYRDDVRSGKELVGMSKMLEGSIKVVVSKTQPPTPPTGVTLIWIEK